MFKFKGKIALLLLVGGVLVMSEQAYAQGTNSIKVSLDGKEIGQGYIAQDNNTMIAVRDIADVLGYTLKWEPTNEKAILQKSDLTIEVMVDYHLAKVNDSYVQLKSNPTTKKGATYVPLSFLSDVLGLEVGYGDKVAYIWDISEKSEMPKGDMLGFEEVPIYLLGNGYRTDSHGISYFKYTYDTPDGVPRQTSFAQAITDLVTISFGDNSPEGLAFIKDFLYRFVPSCAEQIYQIISTEDVIPLQIIEADGKKIAFQAGANTTLDFTFDGTVEGVHVQEIMNRVK